MTGCHRCGGVELTEITGISGGCEWVQTICEGCEHRWGDGYPDAAGELLSPGHADCGYCEGRGDVFGRDCRRCVGSGQVVTTSVTS